MSDSIDTMAACAALTVLTASLHMPYDEPNGRAPAGMPVLEG